MVAPQTSDTHALPGLESGVTLLETSADSMAAMQTLVLDHVLMEGGDALWVDARNNAATHKLMQVAPSTRTLAKIRVARAFTAFQHHSIVDDLVDEYDDGISLLVLPAIDWFYGDDDLRRGEGESMLTDALETIQELAHSRDVPALLTRHRPEGVGESVLGYVDHELECEYTKLGPRFTGEEFETLLYHGDGYVQTTLAYWRRVLEQRHPAAFDTTPAPSEVTPVGSH